MIFEWIALIVAFGIFFGIIIDKHIEYYNCCSSHKNSHVKLD